MSLWTRLFGKSREAKDNAPPGQDNPIEPDLIEAARAGNVELVRAALKCDSDINRQGESQATALVWTVRERSSSKENWSGRRSVADELLRAGADADIADDEGKTAMFWIVSHPVFPAVIRRGDDPGGSNEERMEISKLLIRHGAKVDIPSNSGATPLFEAARHGNLDAIRILVDAGADPNAVDKKGNNILLALVGNDPAHGDKSRQEKTGLLLLELGTKPPIFVAREIDSFAQYCYGRGLPKLAEAVEKASG